MTNFDFHYNHFHGFYDIWLDSNNISRELYLIFTKIELFNYRSYTALTVIKEINTKIEKIKQILSENNDRQLSADIVTYYNLEKMFKQSEIFKNYDPYEFMYQYIKEVRKILKMIELKNL